MSEVSEKEKTARSVLLPALPQFDNGVMVSEEIYERTRLDYRFKPQIGRAVAGQTIREVGGNVTRPYNERRNKQVMVLVERRGMMPKQVAVKLHLSIWNVYKIIRRYRNVQICPSDSIDSNTKVA